MKKTSDEDREALRRLREDPRARCIFRDAKGNEKWAKPNPGFDWNPLHELPRNRACPCRSGEKFKKCCLPKLPPIVPEKIAETYRTQMKQRNLIFVTKGNEEFLKAQIPEMPIPPEEPKNENSSAQAD